MTGGIPTEDSYERIMSLVDKDELLFIIQSYLNNKWLTIY